MEIQINTQQQPGPARYEDFEGQAPLSFELPPELEAHEPPEARGLSRDGVRLMVSYRSNPRIVHARFKQLPDFLRPGDVLVINTSATVNAAVSGRREDGSPVEVHFSTRLPSGQWTVELRRPVQDSTEPLFTGKTGERLELSGNAHLRLVAPYQRAGSPAGAGPAAGGVRLWIAEVDLPLPSDRYLERYGFPIRYKHVHGEWPLSVYQTVYADEPGSAEMPSAGRAFTRPLLDRLRAAGILVAPLVLHTGVASLENHEPPPDEFYRVPAGTARAVNQAHRNGGRVIAVGTTAVRALETAAAPDGTVRAGEGWTDLLITPQRGVRADDGLLTGFHEPRSTHLLMLQALASRDRLQQAYSEALRSRYLWHEFGDLHLILP